MQDRSNKSNTGKVRSFAEIFGEDLELVKNSQTGIDEIDIAKLIPFEGHPFKLYEGQRLNDMVASIKEMGVILPIVVRAKGNDEFEILSGHNRVNAAKIAGLSKVPAVIKECLTEEEASLIVTETNLLQRSFSDLSYSERAVALKRHYEAIKSQGKRMDLINEIEMLSKLQDKSDCGTCGQVVLKVSSREISGKNYDFSGRTVSRYIKLNELIPELLLRVDNEEIAFIPAVALSFVGKSDQQEIERVVAENEFKVNIAKTDLLKSYSLAGTLTADKIYGILSGEINKNKKSNKPTAIKIKQKVISKYFTPEQKSNEIERIIEMALEMYFGKQANS